MPKIIGGSSVGSLVASIFATKTKEEYETMMQRKQQKLTYLSSKKHRSFLAAAVVRLR